MTIEKLLGMSADELACLSDEQLLEYFKDILQYTRPIFSLSSSRKKDKSTTMSVKHRESIITSLAREAGVSLEDLNKALNR